MAHGLHAIEGLASRRRGRKRGQVDAESGRAGRAGSSGGTLPEGATPGARTAANVKLTIEELYGRNTCSVEEAALVLEVGRSTAYKAAKDGSLPVLRISNRLLVSVPRLLALLGAEAPEAKAHG